MADIGSCFPAGYAGGMPDLTAEQNAAVELRNSSVVLASGAGCGKTHVLTARFVSHLKRDNAAVAQVVAITFTDRAAREMRDRIREAVEKLPEPQKHLRDLETAQITTIHSFCGNLLRQYAVPAGLDAGFEVLDDILSTNLRTDAITGCLHGLLEAEPTLKAAAALRELAVLFGYPAVVEAIESLLREVDRPRWQEWLAREPADIAAEWAGSMRDQLLPRWVTYLAAASPKISHCLAVLEQVESKNSQVVSKVRGILEGVPNLHVAQDLEAKVKELCELAKVQGTKKADWGNDELYEAVKKSLSDFRGDLPKRLDLFLSSAEGVAEAAHIGQQFLLLALAVDDDYRRRKRRASVLDFQDLLVLARDLLRDHKEVRDAVRERFLFVLLDELQDTDPVQMELVELLCGAGLQHGKLFAVGDHKQSIYRFRGADVSLFTRLRESVASEGRLDLTLNFRSQPGVTRFVNALFAKRLEEYQPLKAHHQRVGDADNVEFLWAIPANDQAQSEDEANEGDSSASPRRSSQELREAEADAIARRIVELLADPKVRLLGEKENDPPRRIERKDITLLFRSMTNVATYEAALRRHGLDYYLVGGRAFFAQQEVYDLLNLLRTIENPYDSASLVGALRSPFCNLSDEAIFLLAIHQDGPWAGLHDPDQLAKLPADQRPAVERATRRLAGWREWKDRLPIARLLNRILADTGYDAALQFEFLGERKLANLWKLIDIARDFDRTGLFGLHEFAARLGDLVSRQPREELAATLPETADVVKLMSIHQAKGLEFPVVFVPDFAAQGRGNQFAVARWHRELGCLVRLPYEFDSLPEDEPRPFSSFPNELGRMVDQLADWQEDLRVLYVACTRARDLLILSTGLPGSLMTNDHLPANHWTLALEERFNIQTGQCIASDVLPGERPDVRVVLSEACQASGRFNNAGSAIHPGAPGAFSALPEQPRPAIYSLPALEARARGEPVTLAGAPFDTEDDSDRAEWRSLRERVGALSPSDRVFWAVLERWDLVKADGWSQLLDDALAGTSHEAIGNELKPKLARFAQSPVRATLAAAEEIHRNVEFLVDLNERDGNSAPMRLRGVIDYLYRDAAGWHLLAIDRGSVVKGEPWLGRKPGLFIQAGAVFQQLGTWPASIQLFNLASGKLVSEAPGLDSFSAGAEHFLRAAKTDLRSE